MKLSGSDQAFKRVGEIVDQWENTRTGCFEQFAEYVMTNRVTLDEGLNEMARRGELDSWPVFSAERCADGGVDNENFLPW